MEVIKRDEWKRQENEQTIGEDMCIEVRLHHSVSAALWFGNLRAFRGFFCSREWSKRL